MSQDRPSDDIDRLATTVAHHADLAAVAAALDDGRDRILAAWLARAPLQPFHEARPAGAVADHIPVLFSAIIALLASDRGPDARLPAPGDDPAIVAAATAHAQARFEQGLGPVAVITEFRLLRIEIGRALAHLIDDVPPDDVVASLTIVGDALDSAATVGLSALSDRIEDLRESFLASTLHDVRQPITLVEGALRLSDRWLASDAVDIERVRESVADALSATAELMAMIETLSDASRVAVGQLRPELEPASLEAVVRDAVSAFGGPARARIVIGAPTRHLIGLWDVHLLHRLVANLVGNALKYSPPTSEVLVKVARDGSSWASLVVHDDGLGLTPEELDAAFERFGRADRARRQGIPGLGLGLYACRGIVDAHEGTITLHSDGPERGTTVTVRLPLLEEMAD